MASKNAESAARRALRAGLEWRAVVARCQNGGGPARLWAAIDARRAGHIYGPSGPVLLMGAAVSATR